jgi:hypothetical protein
MASTSLRVEDRLDGASNFLSLKARVTLALKEYYLWELVDKVVFHRKIRKLWQLTRRRSKMSE